MELWIRSQDKEMLILANHLDIYNGTLVDGEEETWYIEESGTDIGEYKTKERALEVLDEIQEKIKNGIDILHNKSYTEGTFRDHELTIDIPYTKIIVYEMPQE